jgi:transposase
VLSTGCEWQALPKDRRRARAHSYFMLWDWDGTLERVHHALYAASPTRAAAPKISNRCEEEGISILVRPAIKDRLRVNASNEGNARRLIKICSASAAGDPLARNCLNASSA